MRLVSSIKKHNAIIVEPVNKASGFSLLEIIVVMFIIGIIMSFVMLSVGQSQSKVVQEEIRRIHALIKLGKEESVLQAQEMAIEIYRNGYQFTRLGVDGKNWKWLPISGDKLFRPRCFPANIYVELVLEGDEVSLEERDCQSLSALDQADNNASFLDKSNDEDEATARVFFLSSGEMTPFTLVMFLEDVPTQGLSGELTGDLKIVQQGELNE